MKQHLGLDQFSERTYDYLSINFPEILEFAIFEKGDSGDNFLRIEKTCPNPNAEYGIYFDSEDQGFTVGFDLFHCHLFRFAGQDFDSELANAVQIIKDILNSELFVLKFVDGDRYLGSQLVEKKELDSLDEIIVEWNLKSNENGIIVSWDGCFDQEIERKNESRLHKKADREDLYGSSIFSRIKRFFKE